MSCIAHWTMKLQLRISRGQSAFMPCLVNAWNEGYARCAWSGSCINVSKQGGLSFLPVHVSTSPHPGEKEWNG